MQITLETIPYFFFFFISDIITLEQARNKETIVLYILINGEEEKREIKIEGRTHFVFFEPLNITIIEILDIDNISKDRFLYPDLNYKKGYDAYLNKSYHIVGFEKDKDKTKIFISTFKMKDYFFHHFNHNKNKSQEATGSLICTKNNFNIIGINSKNKFGNCGIFIGHMLDKLENSRKGIIEENYVALYEGMVCYGLRHGKGIAYYNDGSVYEGDWINDSKEGKGKMYYSNGNIYDGEWINNRREGKGIFYFCTGAIYEGDFKNNIIDGFGKLIVHNRNRTLEFLGTLKIPSLDNPNFDPFYLFQYD